MIDDATLIVATYLRVVHWATISEVARRLKVGRSALSKPLKTFLASGWEPSSLLPDDSGYVVETLFFHLCPISAILKYIDNAHTLVDLCAYLITCQEKTANASDNRLYLRYFVQLANALVRAKEREVTVRITADKSCAASGDSMLQFLKDNFCVVDDEYLLNGSMNWSVSGYVGNVDNVQVQRCRPAVPYIIEFESLLNRSFELEIRAACTCACACGKKKTAGTFGASQ